MRIKCIGTGSKGNCYLITSNSGNKLMVEAGLSLSEISNNIGKFNDLDGCIISHSHNDHDRKLGNKQKFSDFLRYSLVKVLTPENSEIGKLYKIGEFKVIPLECNHSVVCYGYLILVDNLKILFATDTTTIPKVNVKCDYYMVEVNYDLDIMENLISKLLTEEEESVPNHIASVYHNHCSLQTVEDYFNNILGDYKPKGIFTIHASMSGILDYEKVYETLSKFSDNVIVVEGGLEIEC